MRTGKWAAMSVLLALSGWAGISSAAEQGEVVMGEVVVTASRQAEETVKVPANVTVITAEDIEESTAQNVAELLRTQAGFHIMDTGGNNRNYYVDLRGFGESSPQNVLLLVDGRRVNLPDLSGPDWRLIPLDRIDRIEIIRGSRGAVLYGDNATEGVINIITKAGRKLGAAITTKFGSYDTFKGNAAVSGANDTVSFDISSSYLYSDGYRDNSESISKDIGANLRLDPSERFGLHFSAGYHYDDTNNPGDILESQFDQGADRTDTFSPDDFDRVDDYYVKAGIELDILSGDMFKLETSFRDRKKMSFGTTPYYYFEAEAKTDVFSVSPQFIFKEDFGEIANSINFGVDYSQAKQKYDSDGTFGSVNATLKKENSAFFLFDELDINGGLGISGGYRADRVVYKYDPADIRDKNIFDEESYNVGLNYNFGHKSHIYGSYTHSFRYPALDEQYTLSTGVVNTKLNPQTSQDYEIGSAIEVFSGIVLSVNFFRIETEDEIFYNPTIAPYGDNDNMDGTTIRQGAEFGFSGEWGNWLLSAYYTYTETDIDGGIYDGMEVPLVPNRKIAAKLNYNIGWGISIGADAIYVGEQFLLSDYYNEYDKADDYTVVNANVRYTFKMVTFFADFNNIFNEEYSAFSGIDWTGEPGYYPSPEFNFLVGATINFGII